MKRGDVWWVSASPTMGAKPHRPHPVVIISADSFNRSKIATVLAVRVSSDRRLAAAPGNFLIEPPGSGLDREAVVDVSRLMTLPRGELERHSGRLNHLQLVLLDEGLRLALAI